ncbi:MAG: MoaD/ThiS family protein [Bacillota bacterium]|nr:MoaD/ThiS family protein [Bacillota bacterium]
MVSIKLFGTLRLKTGCKGLEADVSTVAEACELLAGETGMSAKDFRKCIIVINGTQSKPNAALQEGDELAFFSPSGGG